MRAKPSLALAATIVGVVAALSVPAHAACKKFGFTVNDYGKDGPTNDAKNLLDKHISEWAAQNKVTEYQTGKKSVSCELFLDVVLFDEHTCTASATVCWGADAKKLGEQSATAPGDASGAGTPPAPVRKAAALGHAKKTAATPAAPAEPAAAPAAEAADNGMASEGAAPTSPVEHVAVPAESPATTLADDASQVVTPGATPATYSSPVAPPAATPAAASTTAPGAAPTGVETGTLQAGQGMAPAAQKRAAVPTEKDRAAAAAAAASAAAAAERAAVAAETAANAAKEAAAAAVAASAASKGGVSVPPLNHASGAKPAHTE